MATSASRMLLLADIDEPGLCTLDVYERRGGYQALRKALQTSPEEVLEQLKASGIRGRGGAGFAMGTKVSFLPKGGMEKYLVCNADESEPGTFKDRELMQKNPHSLIEGIAIASYAAGTGRAFIYIRGEYVLQADILDGALREARAAGYVGENVLGLGAFAVADRAPRRRRVHLRRGDRAARLARGQARKPAAEATVPRDPGPLPGPDADQQRRDADDGAVDHGDGRRGVREARRGDLDGHEGGVRVGARAATRELRDRTGHALARDHLRPRRRAARWQAGEVLVPRRLVLAGAEGRGPRRPLRLQLDGPGRLDARLGRDHRRRRLHADPGRGDEGREVLPPRVLRQVHAVPRGHELDGEDARTDRRRRGHADGPRHHGLRSGAHHRQLPVRARRRDGHADRIDDRQVPRGVRSAHRRGPHAPWPERLRGVGGGACSPGGVRCLRPEPNTITFTIDGRK